MTNLIEHIVNSYLNREIALKELPENVLNEPLFDNIYLKDLACPCCDRIIINRDFLTALAMFQMKVGKIKINSAFRCELHNKIVGGSKNSFHKKGMAVDIDMKIYDRFKWGNIKKIAEDYFKGIGTSMYWKNDIKIMHLDVRNTKHHVFF